MNILQKLSGSFLSRQNSTIQIVSALSVLGTFAVLSAGIWDSASHALRVPDNFWTLQHTTIYLGVLIVALSAIIGTLHSLKNKKFSKGLTIILIGVTLQLVGGFVDYNFHEKYGIDGLVTPSHLTIEFGLFLSSIGGLLEVLSCNNPYTKRIIPVSVMTVLLSTVWIVFNLSILFGAPILCLPVYEIFSSGCAVM